MKDRIESLINKMIKNNLIYASHESIQAQRAELEKFNEESLAIMERIVAKHVRVRAPKKKIGD
jgi:hypothetical protein